MSSSFGRFLAKQLIFSGFFCGLIQRVCYLQTQGYHIEGMDRGVGGGMAINDTGVTLCRENQGSLEELFKCAVCRLV